METLSPDRLSTLVLDTLEHQLELVYRELTCLEVLGDVADEQFPALLLIGECLDELRYLADTLDRPVVTGYESIVMNDGSIGRPTYDIPKEQLEFLLSKKFPVPKVASLLGVSVSTVRRRMEQHGLTVHALYSALSDCDLDALVRSIQERFGVCGNRQMQGHLLAQGVRVQQQRVRESQRRVAVSCAD